jgi:hypothetical protein
VAEFRKKTNGPAVTAKLLVTGKTATLFLLAPSVATVAVTPADPGKLAVSGLKQLKFPNPGKDLVFSQFDVKAIAPGKTSITADITGAPPADIKLVLTVNVEDPITLPDINTDAGALCRLFLHENLTPFFPGFKADATLKGMQWMRNVMENRRNKKPELFGLKKSETIINMLHNASQFGDLSTYPTLTSDFQGTLDTDLRIAQDDDNPKQQAFADYVRNAISVATSPEPVDPSPNGLFFWRTEGSGSPGGQAVLFQSTAGNTFYTIKSTK